MSMSCSTSQPRLRSMPEVISTSRVSGQFCTTHGPSASNAATMCLVAAFFDPRTMTSPCKGPTGSIRHDDGMGRGYAAEGGSGSGSVSVEVVRRGLAGDPGQRHQGAGRLMLELGQLI